MKHATLSLEGYRCRQCGRGFYVNAAERRDLDLDFSCPYGCDDNGRYIGAVRAEAAGAKEVK